MSNLDTKHLVYKPKNKVRFVTAASLFDGHDASINIMRRILQGSGCEVIHLGHNRSVKEVVDAALQEDAHGIALSSYQGGHVEYFKYMIDMLKEAGASHIKVFGGGGGVIERRVGLEQLDAEVLAGALQRAAAQVAQVPAHEHHRIDDAPDIDARFDADPRELRVEQRHIEAGGVVAAQPRRRRPERPPVQILEEAGGDGGEGGLAADVLIADAVDVAGAFGDRDLGIDAHLAHRRVHSLSDAHRPELDHAILIDVDAGRLGIKHEAGPVVKRRTRGYLGADKRHICMDFTP